jgi:enterochelin esterase-like enzyme
MNDVGTRIYDHKHPLIAELESSPESESSFWDAAASRSTPLIEPDPGSARHTLTTYVYRIRSDEGHVVVQPGGFADPPANLLERVPGTGTCHACFRYRNDVRLHYTFALDMPLVSWDDASEKEIETIEKAYFAAQPDPHNAKQAKLQFRSASLLELSEAPDESLVYKRPDIDRGELTQSNFTSHSHDNDRSIRVYTPPDYHRVVTPCKLLLVLDGDAYLSLIPTHRILDNLLYDQAIDPLVAVFVGNATPTSRDTELACNESFLQFIGEELMPWVREHYRVSDIPEDVYVGGSSLGGLTSLWLGYRLPHMIGNVISQAAGLGDLTRTGQPAKPGDQLYRQIERSKRLPLKFWMEVGLLDDHEKIIEPNRRMKALIQSKGYPLHYHEFAGGHDFVLWRGTFARAIKTMMAATQ